MGQGAGSRDEKKKEEGCRPLPPLEKLCVRLVQVIFGGILLLLTAASAFFTCRVYGGKEIVECGRDWPLFHLALLALLIWLGVKRGRRKGNLSYTVIVAVMMAVFFAWLLALLICPGSDSRLSMRAARAFLQGDYSPWRAEGFFYGSANSVPTGYAYTYPSQNGLILYMTPFALFFGEAAPYVMQAVNLGFLLLGLVSLGKLAKAVFKWRGREKSRKLVILMLAFLPFSFYYLFAYGTMPGFGLSCLALSKVFFYVREGRRRDFWAAALAAAAAVLLKPNYLIALTALVLFLASEGVFRRRPRFLAAALLMVIVYLGSHMALSRSLAAVTGCPTDEGIPMTAWVEMGLQEGARGPGWFNSYIVLVFSENGADKERTKAAVLEDLRETAEEMAKNPGEALQFFVKKTVSIWTEPTFQSLWIQEVGGGSWLLPEVTDSLLKKGGSLNEIYVGVFNALQTLIYAGALLFVALRWRKIRWEQLIPAIIFIGGFIFHLFWEAKGQYTVCYFVLLIPYAWEGLDAAAALWREKDSGERKAGRARAEHLGRRDW